jgi:hypothetical protein
MSKVVLRWVLSFGLLAPLMLCQPPTSSATTQVYECKVEGRRIFSDQPCAADAKQRDIGESNRMDAQPVSITTPDAPVKKKRVVDSSDKKQRVARCNRIREQLENIRSQERAGYTAKQGERLRERRVKLDEQYRSQRCERYR